MNVFYEEDGGFKIGYVMSDIGTSLQVEAQTGKRSKIKATSVLLRFEHPPLADFLPAAEQLAAEIQPDFLWEVCGEAEFAFDDLAQDYYGHKPSSTEAAAVAICLHAAPMYFYKRGKGRYQAAPEENLKAALASIERKKREAEQMAGWVAQLIAGTLPEEVRPHLSMLLYKPDRNTLLVKAAEAAVAQSNLPLPRLLFNAGAWPDREHAPYHYHLGKFLAEYFPRGRQYIGELDVRASETIADAPDMARAFSIDDANTTEIDDAFSVRTLPDGNWEIGIHIAAPALTIPTDSALDKLAQSRLSTVYFPSDKITMLPDEAVALSTLAAGRTCPAVSMYATFSASDLSLIHIRSAIDQVVIEANLRIGELESYFHEGTVAPSAPHPPEGPYGSALLLLYRIAGSLAARRGKTGNEQDRVDYNIEIAAGTVHIGTRKRGNPIDTLVSEFMILVNAEWGRLLAEQGFAAIYRAQQNMKTRMTIEPLPHEGLGVAQYAWSSSPLRRYVDLINQRQLVALLRSEEPPFPKRSPVLRELAHRFDLTYDAYQDFQRNLERYWCLRYLEQNNVHQVEATILRDEVVRVSGMPLIIKLDKSPGLPPKTVIFVKIEAIDYWDIGGRFTLVS